ncbi:MAG: hypothetical protein RLZZ387_1641 [Chloroflexota bacterium]|jgi:uncharacterized Tic20 family protein
MHPDDDERLLGALAHASVVANIVNLAGIVTATIIWATQRERSRFVRGHALQALAYQGVVLLALLLMMVVWGACMTLSLLPAILRPELYTEGGPPTGFWVVLATLVLPLGLAAASVAYGLFGAYQVFRGRPFRYPLAGRLVEAQSAKPGAQSGAPAQPPPLVMPPPAEAPAAPKQEKVES